MGDHTETFQVDFDPDVISYETLLDLFWSMHNPTRIAFSRQYRAVILAADERQRTLAEASRDAQVRIHGSVQTPIESLTRFTRAEDYHQKYYLRSRRPAFAAVKALFPDERAFVDSTLATQANAVLGYHLEADALTAELDRLGVPDPDRARLLESL